MFTTRSQFYKPKDTEQKPNEVVDITGFSIDGSFSSYPDGSRAKFEVFCPSDTLYQFLIPHHRYLFKKTLERKSGVIYYEQFWTEIIAYKLGRILDIAVPPAFVAYYSNKVKGSLEYASLIEWYYKYPNEKWGNVNRGGDYMSRAIPDYDRKKGKLHNFETITDIFTAWLHVENWQQKWVEILLFDAIIGNTDRHQANWEIYSFVSKDRRLIEELSPAFDNGTSMGYDILAKNISKKLSNLEAYVNKGTHHMMWLRSDIKHAGHFELLQKLVDKFPQTKQSIITKLQIDISPISQDILQLTEFHIHNPFYKLTEERANFIIKLIDFRYTKLRKMFNV